MNVLNQFTWSVWGCYVNVRRTYLDADGTETDVAANKTSLKYYITLRKLINDVSTNSISIVKTNTTAAFTVVKPENGVKSSAPLAGSYIITCVDNSGVSWSTDEIPY